MVCSVAPVQQSDEGVGDLHQALLQGFLHRHPEEDRQVGEVHLRPLPGHQREARQEDQRDVERHGGGGEGTLRPPVFVTFPLPARCLKPTVACIYEGGKWPILEGLPRINVHSVERCLSVFVIATHV